MENPESVQKWLKARTETVRKNLDEKYEENSNEDIQDKNDSGQDKPTADPGSADRFGENGGRTSGACSDYI